MKKACLISFLLCGLFQVAFSQKDTVFSDHFNDNKHNWKETDSEKSSSTVENGVYDISHKRTEGSYWYSKSITIDPFRDYYAEIKVKQVSGIDNNGFGLYMLDKRLTNHNKWHYFLLNGTQYYKIYTYHSDKRKSVTHVNWTQRTDLIWGKDEYNTLAVKKEGNMTRFYINGTEVHSQKDLEFWGSKTGFMMNKNMWLNIDHILIKQDAIEIKVVEDAAQGYQKENLGKGVNTKYEELSPVITQDGKNLYFIRKDHPENIGEFGYSDIWYSNRLEDGSWSEAVNIGSPLNNDNHNFVISAMPDGNTLLLGNTYEEDGAQLDQGVSMTKRKKTGWEVPKKVIIDDYYNDNEYVNFFLSFDRKVLICSVEREDTHGDKDLYVCFLQTDGSYTKPKNLGAKINTFASESGPFLAADNVTLYYSTMGKPGYGSADIFVTRRLDDSWTNWSEPLNLGTDINSSDWDSYYTIPASGEIAYLVSYENSFGKGDIFRVRTAEAAKPNPVVLISGKVLNKKDNSPIGAEIIYEVLPEGIEAGLANSNPEDGHYAIVLPAGKLYSFRADAKGFYAISENLDLTGLTEYKEIIRNLYLVPVEVGQTIRMNNIFFDFAKWNLKAASYPELKRMLELLDKYPKMEIEIAGHTDHVGSDESNFTLSKNRTRAVADFLIQQGADKARFTSKGYGESKPIAANDTNEGRALNRRVEFTILKK